MRTKMLWSDDPTKGQRRSAFVYAAAEGLLIGDLAVDTILAADRSKSVPAEPNTVLFDLTRCRKRVEDYLQVPDGWIQDVLSPIVQQGGLGETDPDKRIYGHVPEQKSVDMGGEADLALRTAIVVSRPEGQELGLDPEQRLLLRKVFAGDKPGNGKTSLELWKDLLRFLIMFENARAHLPPSTREVEFNPAKIEARARLNWRLIEIIRAAEDSTDEAQGLELSAGRFDPSEVITEYCESMAAEFEASSTGSDISEPAEGETP